MISKVNNLNPVSFKKETYAEEIIFIDEPRRNYFE